MKKLLVRVLAGLAIAAVVHAGNLVTVAPAKYQFTGKVMNVWPQKNDYTLMFSNEILAQKVSIACDAMTRCLVMDTQQPTQVHFEVEKGRGLVKISTTLTKLATPEGDNQQGAAQATFVNNVLNIKVVRDIKLEYSGNKPTRLLKAGSWYNFVLK